jgi:hypothetical protein
MRRKLAKVVRSRFKRQLGLRLPGFVEDPAAIAPPGWPVYALDFAPNLTFYIVLAVHSMRDSFTAEGAWSHNGRFPSDAGLLWPRSFPEVGVRQDTPRDGGFRFRLTNLWQPRDDWWDLIARKSSVEREKEDEMSLEAGVIPAAPSLEEALSRISTVIDAIGRIEQYLLPYFDEVAAESGHAARVSEMARSRR